ncbi:hypothetical protein [Leptolyngbya sp. 7M]|uniref:hypothetical protein n=1 Tax=Leptolyngbya sp. 7M TaxID=2812896 RepID=UPI001B8ACC53|nr:hypothetical protein [Leptolyngbya sp. 7M]QYO66195.1 hypothetical protein JVX88_05175 [Leptolyngbya sp. 7M]
MKRPDEREKAYSIFGPKRALSESAAWASVVYSLVPLVGIVFVPVSIIFATVSFIRGNEIKVTFKLFLATLVILCAQLGLWWLLYLIPTLSEQR